jgi:hypothetical protein
MLLKAKVIRALDEILETTIINRRYAKTYPVRKLAPLIKTNDAF